jgi:hypothetical protein
MKRVFLLVGYGSALDGNVNTLTFREWLTQTDAQEPMPTLVLGNDTLIFALASTREEDVTDLGVEKLPEEGVISLPNITRWVTEDRIDEAIQQWTILREKASITGFSLPEGSLLLTTGEEEA